MDYEKLLFEKLDDLGEIFEGDLHIIDNSDHSLRDDLGEKSYRVYHKKGYCFDVTKEINEEDDDGNIIGWHFDMYSEWDGFDPINAKEAIELIKI